MNTLPDYSIFIEAAYIIALSTLTLFGLWSIIKFRINRKKLENAQEK